MRFKATDVFAYHWPEKCELRVGLRHRGEPEDTAASPFDAVLQKLGLRHEQRQLAALSGVLDLSGPDPIERERRTLEAIRSGAPALYQPRFRTEFTLEDEACELVGEPDFLLLGADGYRIRDSKLARRIDESAHPEILIQLRLYGMLFERASGGPPAGLEVHSGTGEIILVPYEGPEAAVAFLAALRRMRLTPEDVYEPVGWSKCGACGFRQRCWSRAEAAEDVAILPWVDQNWARRLHGRGVTTIRGLGEAFDDPSLRDLFYKKATKKKPERLRDSAARIRHSAEAHATGAPVPISALGLPDSSDCVTLDLEGLPPHLDELEKIYLWGIKDHRSGSPRYFPAQAGLGPEGDRAGWREFLRIAARLLAESPDLRFVHWASYEKTKIVLYAARYGDPDGTAARILERLVDLYSLLTHAFALPVPSYGLKSVEKLAGFTRALPESNGTWAMARYIEAIELSDPAARDDILGEILAYNEEDLDSTRAVMEWLRGISSPSPRCLATHA